MSPSEEVTKTWVKGKRILIKSRPQPSRFSFVVCLSIVFSIAFGFLGGFITAGFALNENYSTVYENLLTELEATRQCLEREKKKLQTANIVTVVRPENAEENASSLKPSNNQLRDQAIVSVFSQAIKLIQENDIEGACTQLKNIINLPRGPSDVWKKKAQYLINKKCN